MFRGSRVPQNTPVYEIEAEDETLTDSTHHLCSVQDMCSEDPTEAPPGGERECALENGGHLDDVNNQPNNVPQFFVNMMYEELPPNSTS